MSEILAIAQAIVYGAGAAALSAGYGYAQAYFKKRADGDSEPFNPVKAGSTVALGAVLGSVAGGFGITVIDAQNLLVSVGLFSAVVYVVDAGVKALWRIVKSKWGS